jgi:hypothetical protein
MSSKALLIAEGRRYAIGSAQGTPFQWIIFYMDYPNLGTTDDMGKG